MNEERLEKIRALLAKAEATTFAAEAEVFTAKAQELMRKWSIDEAMLHKDVADPTIDQSFIWIEANEYRGPKIQLLNAIARANDVQLVLYPQGYRLVDGVQKRMFRVSMIGTKTDRDFVEILYTSLTLQIEQELLKPEAIAKMQFECYHPAHRIRWRNTFVLSYAYAVGNRLYAARERAEEQVRQETKQTSSSMALVLVSKKEQVAAAVAKFHPCLGKGKRSSAGSGNNGSAGQMGYEAGQRADVGNPKIKASQTRQIKG